SICYLTWPRGPGFQYLMKILMLNLKKMELIYLYPFYLLEPFPHESDANQLMRFSKINKKEKAIEYSFTTGYLARQAFKEQKVKKKQAFGDLLGLIEQYADRGPRLNAEYLFYDASEKWEKLPVGHVVGKRADRYVIKKYIRSGGIAQIYEVKRLSDDEVFALKVLSPQFLSDYKAVQRFHEEIRITSKLKHPHIVSVVDWGEEFENHYIVMELASGWALNQSKRALDVSELSTPILDIELFLSLVKQVCEGLHYIHNQYMIHRDIKPQNLLLFENRQVKITDFGIARPQEQRISITQTGWTLGTFEYMSPEQAEGERDLKPTTDIYSLGVVMFELLTGKSLFLKNTPLAYMYALKNENAPHIKKLRSDIPHDLGIIIMRCLKKVPAERFATAKELFEALSKVKY
ncbi:serine/threonine protein kinase, partial [candidate division CSSED10-310 bacterium]